MIRKALPAVLRDARPGRTTRPQLEKRLGPALQGSSPSERFYRVKGNGTRSNDLTLGFDSRSTLRYFYYRLPSGPADNQYRFSSFKPLIPSSALENARSKMQRESKQPDAGRVLDVAIPEMGLLLKFDNSDDPTLRAIVSWVPGERKP